jgi:small subunit ribosomal protein S21
MPLGVFVRAGFRDSGPDGACHLGLGDAGLYTRGFSPLLGRGAGGCVEFALRVPRSSIAEVGSRYCAAWQTSGSMVSDRNGFISPGWLLRKEILPVVKLRVRAGESIQEAVRRFRKLCERSGLRKEMRRKAYYEKPSERRRREELKRLRKARQHQISRI